MTISIANATSKFTSSTKRVKSTPPISFRRFQGSMKRYLFEQELEAYKKLRDEDKASKLLKVVFKAITTEYRFELAFEMFSQRTLSAHSAK